MTDLPWPSPDGRAPDGPTTPAADAAVRHARAEDVPAMARVQAAAWRAAYVDVAPAEVLDVLDRAVEDGWAEAVAAQAPRRHVLVATAGDVLVGLASFAAAEDPDLDPAADAELGVLVVDPDHTRRGHASRLLAAAVDLLREDKFTHAFTWVPSQDDPLRRLLVESGWAADGARRTLEAGPGTEVHQLRLHTDLRTG